MNSYQGNFIFEVVPGKMPGFGTRKWIRVVVVAHVLLGIFTIVPSMVKASGDGSLDATFGSGGKVITSVTVGDSGKSVVVQSNGKIVVAGDGFGDIELVRYNVDGSLDVSFDSDGKVVTDVGFNDSGNAVALQNDGKIVVAGTTGTPTTDFAIVRYSTDGSLDPSFGTGGIVTTSIGRNDDAKSVVIQSDGKIVVAGTSDSDFVVVRYTSSGVLDSGFGTGGKVTTDIGSSTNDSANSVAIQSDGAIVVAGTDLNDFALVRYTSTGALDNTFDTDGKLTTDIGSSTSDSAKSIAIQSDGAIVVAGTSSSNFAVVRYASTGALDNTFDTDGKLTTDIGSSTSDSAKSIAIQSDGAIVVAGTSSSNFALVRYALTGALDNTFDTDGKLSTDIGSSTNDSANSVAIQSDGAIVVAGTSANDFAIVRYTSAGALDTGFGTGGKVTTDIGTSTFDSAQSLVIQADSKIVVAGRSSAGAAPSFAVTRYEVAPSSPPASTSTTSSTIASTSTTIAPVAATAPETSTTSTTTVAITTTTTIATDVRSSAPSISEKSLYLVKILAKTSHVKISSSRAVVSILISKDSTKICTRAGNRIKTIKPGMCVITFIVQEPTNNGVRSKVSRTTRSFVVK